MKHLLIFVVIALSAVLIFQGRANAQPMPPSCVCVENQLLAPEPNVVSESGNISISWEWGNADSYRVLYWKGNETPQEHLTTDTTWTFPSLGTGSYTIIVEAYDLLGNSLFSDPVALDIL
jgi:hypothetical protein